MANYSGDGANFAGSRTAVGLNSIINTFAGATYGGDGGPATAALLWNPSGVATDSTGDLFIADYVQQSHPRGQSFPRGVITTVAGNGTAGYGGDNGPGHRGRNRSPQGVAVDASGDLFIADYGNDRIREVNLSTGVITTVAGHGTRAIAAMAARPPPRSSMTPAASRWTPRATSSSPIPTTTGSARSTFPRA